MRILSFITLLFVSHFLLAQNDTSCFKMMKKIEANEYTFSVPEKWENKPQVVGAPLLQKFEFTDVALPHMMNNAPLTANLTVRKLPGDSAAPAINFITDEITNYPDRITPPGFNYDKEPFTIASGETGTLIFSHYYRRAKVSNYTRYDLIVYSHKRKAAYMITVTYQYKDPNYRLEADFKFKEYAIRVLKTFALR